MVHPCINLVTFTSSQEFTSKQLFLEKRNTARAAYYRENIVLIDTKNSDVYKVDDEMDNEQHYLVKEIREFPGKDWIFKYKGEVIVLNTCVVVLAWYLKYRVFCESNTFFLLTSIHNSK